jgi:hypothetical protein
MNNLNWVKVSYNGQETNVEVTKCGRVRKIKTDWFEYGKYNPYYNYREIDLSKLKLNLGYYKTGIEVKNIGYKSVAIHQLVAAAFLGYKFMGYKNVVDHIDSNTLNNHLENLRVVSHRENMSKEKTIKSGLPTGVCFDKSCNKYKAQIVINGKNKHLGRFKTIEEAQEIYKKELSSLV